MKFATYLQSFAMDLAIGLLDLTLQVEWFYYIVYILYKSFHAN
jgi:hypothetical protein